ncbi:MAG: patatin family protein [Oscillospiraceae bacterium]|nr:patatin family protein [Oscillospiraceae bacterium]
MAEKLGLIDVGGGMRGIYGAGVLDCFLERGLRFDYCIGVSAGAANILSFLAGQRGRNYRFYTDYAFDKRYMGVGNLLRTGSFFGLDFIYDTLTNIVDPIDYDALLRTKSEFRVVATDAATGRAAYFGNRDVVKGDMRILMASCALPAICRPVEIGGRAYFDGGAADPVPVDTALGEGCDRLVVILTKPVDFIKRRERFRLVYSTCLTKYPGVIDALDQRHTAYMRSIGELLRLQEEGRAVIIAPSEDFRMGTASKKLKLLNRMYELGQKDAAHSLNRLRAVL